jgi:UDP-N-acetyl-D-glucosamine dehydrogenase
VRVIADALNERGKPLKGSRILALGVAYKRDTNDVRESPALQVLAGLVEKGASIYFSDPYVSSINIRGKTMKSADLTAESLQSMDCTVILTDHSAINYSLVAKFSPLVIDTRNALREFSRSGLILL